MWEGTSPRLQLRRSCYPGQEGLRGPLEVGILDRHLQRWWPLRALPSQPSLSLFCPMSLSSRQDIHIVLVSVLWGKAKDSHEMPHPEVPPAIPTRGKGHQAQSSADATSKRHLQRLQWHQGLAWTNRVCLFFVCFCFLISGSLVSSTQCLPSPVKIPCLRQSSSAWSWF